MSDKFIRSKSMSRFERFESFLRTRGHSTYVSVSKSDGSVAITRATDDGAARIAFSPADARALAAELLAAADAAERDDAQEAA